jgi:hypothetical protein
MYIGNQFCTAASLCPTNFCFLPLIFVERTSAQERSLNLLRTVEWLGLSAGPLAIRPLVSVRLP